MMRKYFIFVFVLSIFLYGCMGQRTATLKIMANESVGDKWSCYSITPEGVVKVISSKYRIYLPFPGMWGRHTFKFKSINEGEADIILLNNYREGKFQGFVTYHAVVDKKKRLTIVKKEINTPQPDEE